MKVVFHSFEGRYSDSPRAVYEGLIADGREPSTVWLADPQHLHAFPPDAVTVAYGSREAVRVLESADVVVSNTHIEFEWEKAPGCVYLQTWHGTPLKRIHFDVLWALPGRLERLTRDVRRWDALLSPNPASTGPLRGAFAFCGDVLETGYPRNDVLSSPRRDEVRARVRCELGIPEGKRAVLYTPTWRDDLHDAEGNVDFTLHLDLADAAARLGEDCVLLLRLHYMLSDQLGPLTAPLVRDVSTYPDVAELYLAADAMVTDYSSTMFDFAITGKPMVFFAYDLEHYRDNLRGFYFDFPDLAPGPVVRTSAEVVDALLELDAVHERYADAYVRFQDRFCVLEDGRATERVLARFFPSEPNGPRLALTAGPAGR